MTPNRKQVTSNRLRTRHSSSLRKAMPHMMSASAASPKADVDGDDLLPGAELLYSLFAEGTTKASLLLVTDTHTIAPVQVSDLGTKLFDDSNDLMARDQGKPRLAPFIIHELDVAPRNATGVILTRTSWLPTALS